MLVAVAGDFAVTVRQMPQRKLFCGGQLLDYKRRQVCCDGEVTSGGGTALPDKTYVLSFVCGEAAGLNRPRERLLSVAAVIPAIPHYALRIPH